ncbi:MATE family efflux transporter [Methanovulcanius yangii]|uniref:MATE family efflux transporter n=1 Tax=Methanovulcanius yangii TaxID=1789227 RepID=UPI0029CA2DDB|nr:MATE family efflux transporter [Methanovulcanius yangii]
MTHHHTDAPPESGAAAHTTNTPSSTSQPSPTRGVSILTGDPKKAILKLSGPMIVAMFLLMVYNIVDAIWVAGLGADALAAIGFFTPIFLILIGLGNGIGSGVTAAIARHIGARDKASADNTTMHAFLITGILSIVLTVVLLACLEPLLVLIGAGPTLDLALEYGTIVLAGTVFVLFTNIGYGILRAEGDMKRTMYALAASSVLNLVLDPIFIYTLGMGIAGAAVATVISVAAVSGVLVYWFVIRRDTYVDIHRRSFSYSPVIIRDILSVGLPASAEFMLMSLVAVVMNSLLVFIAGTDAVAVYTAGWRVIQFAMVPLIAIGTAVIAVAGALYGARRISDLKVVHTYSVGIGTAASLAMSVLTWVFASQIAMVFCYTEESAHLLPELTAFLRTMCFLYPFIPIGIMSSNIFQAIGRGLTSFILAFMRNVILIIVFAALLGLVLGLGERGIWWGIIAGDVVGGILAYSWAVLAIRRLNKEVSEATEERAA